jgi:hypothetical protein
VLDEPASNGEFIRQVFAFYASAQTHSFGGSRGGSSFEQMAKEAEHMTQGVVMRMCRDFEIVPFLLAKHDVVHVMVDGRRAITFGAFKAYLVELALRSKAQLELALAGHLHKREDAMSTLFAVAYKQWAREKGKRTKSKQDKSKQDSSSGSFNQSEGGTARDSTALEPGSTALAALMSTRISRSFLLKKVREDAAMESAFDIPVEQLCAGLSGASKDSFEDFCAAVSGQAGEASDGGSGMDASHDNDGDEEVMMLSEEASVDDPWLTVSLQEVLTALNEQWADFLVLVREKRSEFSPTDKGISPQKGRGRHHLTDKEEQEDAAKCLQALLQYLMSKASNVIPTKVPASGGGEVGGSRAATPAVMRRTSLVFGAEGARSGDLSATRAGMYTV